MAKYSRPEGGLREMHCVCRDCGTRFDISPQEMDWLKSLGLEPFSRCRDCRAKRRAARGV